MGFGGRSGFGGRRGFGGGRRGIGGGRRGIGRRGFGRRGFAGRRGFGRRPMFGRRRFRARVFGRRRYYGGRLYYGRRYRRRRLFWRRRYRPGMVVVGGGYNYGGDMYDDDVLIPRSSGGFENLGEQPTDDIMKGVVHLTASCYDVCPSQLNFTFSKKMYPPQMQGRLSSSDWDDIHREFNSVLQDYHVDYDGLQAATFSSCCWCLLFLFFILPYLCMACAFSSKKKEIREAETARENALDVKVDEMNEKYKAKGVVFGAGDNALYVEIKMLKRYNIQCPPGAAYPQMVTTRITFADGKKENVVVPVPKGVLPGQTFQAQYTPGSSSMVVIGCPMTFQADLPEQPSTGEKAVIYTPTGQPVELSIPAGTSGKINYELIYDANGVPVARAIAGAPDMNQKIQAMAFDKIAEFGEADFKTANYHPEDAEELVDPSHLGKVQVVCPPGVYAGSLIQVKIPSGQTLQAAVPIGVSPGMKFEVQIPPPAGSPNMDEAALKSGIFLKDAMEMDWATATAPPAPRNIAPPSGGAAGMTLDVMIPAGCFAGAQFNATGPSGQTFTVTVPPGMQPGQSVRVTVPGPAPAAVMAAPQGFAPQTSTEAVMMAPQAYAPQPQIQNPAMMNAQPQGYAIPVAPTTGLPTTQQQLK